MRVDAAGTGPPLVLLPGWGMRANVWEGLSTLLTSQFSVLSVDLPAADSSPDALDAMAAVLADKSPPRVIVCGWSLGGQVALRWALLRPTQVERLILIATTPRFVSGAGWNHGMTAPVFDAFAGGLEHDVNGTMQRFNLLQAHGEKDARSVVRRLSGCVAAGKKPVTALANGLRLLRDTDLRTALPSVTQRVLLLHGDRDAVVPFSAGEYLHHTLPRAEMTAIDGAAHAPFIAQPQAVARRIAEFGHG
jgi:pimeloyl-[acyl-carrier protein] methyl ester esterase